METIKTSEFRQEVESRWPHVKVFIRTVAPSGQAGCAKQLLTVMGEKKTELREIHSLAKSAGIIGDDDLCLLTED